MQWLKSASIDEIIASLPPEYYKSNESVYREAISKNISAFTWDGIVTRQAAQNVLDALATMEPEFKTKKVNLNSTYDNSFTEVALKKYGSK